MCNFRTSQFFVGKRWNSIFLDLLNSFLSWFLPSIIGKKSPKEIQVTSRFLPLCLPSSFVFYYYWQKMKGAWAMGMGPREQRLESFDIPHSVGIFLTKSPPQRVLVNHAFDIDGKLRDEAASTRSEEPQRDFNTWLGWLGTRCLHGGATQQGPPSVELSRATWKCPFCFHSWACTEPQPPRPHTTSTGLETKVFLGLDFYPIFS